MASSDNKSPKPGFSSPAPAAHGDRAKRTIAVALEHDPGRGESPRVTATGKGKVAEQILAIAFAEGVKVREDADLAEVLSLLDVDSLVPTEVLAAVAEILAYVYAANRSLMNQGSAP